VNDITPLKNYITLLYFVDCNFALLMEIICFNKSPNTYYYMKIAKMKSEPLFYSNNITDFQKEQKEKLAKELINAHKELEKTEKKLSFQTKQKEKCSAELIIANKKLSFQNEEKEKRAAELIIANKELSFQNEEKEKRAAELIIANKELAFQNEEKGKKAEELIIANKELSFQNKEKEKRAAELIIANKELSFQNEEKEKKAQDLIIANEELAFQNKEKEKRAAELNSANHKLKKTEKVLLSNNTELKKINSELDRFVYSVSHELRSPLTSIMGLHSIIDHKQMDKGNKEINELINKSIIKMDETIHDILDYSHNSRKEVKVEKIDLRNLIEDAFLQINYINPGFSFDKRIKIKLSEPFYSDKGRISVILNNLISNSMKYGKKQCPDSFIDIKAVIDSKKIVIKIADNGIGIKQECLPRIFEMFYRATIASSGTGLGLYIAKECTEKLNGTIKVKSEFGKGTTFAIEIPNVANSKNEMCVS